VPVNLLPPPPVLADIDTITWLEVMPGILMLFAILPANEVFKATLASLLLRIAAALAIATVNLPATVAGGKVVVVEVVVEVELVVVEDVVVVVVVTVVLVTVVLVTVEVVVVTVVVVTVVVVMLLVVVVAVASPTLVLRAETKLLASEFAHKICTEKR
jgi:hypothetical protein